MRAITWMGLLLMLLSSMSGAQAEEREHHAVAGDAAIADAIARQVTDESEALQEFYSLRDHRPAWQEAAQVEGLVATLHALEEDGLTPQDYRPDEIEARFRSLEGAGENQQRQADFELFASRMLLTALDHLQRGKVDPEALSEDWGVPVKAPDLNFLAISQAVDQQQFDRVLAEARPAYTPYERLREGLARYREIERLGGWQRLPERGSSLRPGDVDDDVALLRERLAVVGELEVMAADTDILPAAELEAPDPRRYDSELEQAVRRFQRRHLLEPDGVVGRQTRAALNVPVERRIDQIRLNMERARWLLHGLPDAYVLVDIAGYRLSYFRPNGEVWRSRIVVGKPYRNTPSLRSEITHMTVNPTWTIPPTIKQNDILPAIRRDLGYLERENINVLSPSGERLDPQEIDWSNPGNVVLRQDAGPQNALGRLAIRFPNDYLVYLHDTPAQGLFSREQRALSSGCIRVENIRELGQLLFDDTRTAKDIEARIASGDTHEARLNSRMPIIMHYWTVNPDDDGVLSFRPDIYERDDKLLRELDRSLTL